MNIYATYRVQRDGTTRTAVPGSALLLGASYYPRSKMGSYNRCHGTQVRTPVQHGKKRVQHCLQLRVGHQSKRVSSQARSANLLLTTGYQVATVQTSTRERILGGMDCSPTTKGTLLLFTARAHRWESCYITTSHYTILQ